MHNIDVNGDLARELDPDLAAWAGTVKTNAILADIYDLLAMINANICALGSGKAAKKPERYKRPKSDKEDDTQQIGKGALPFDELRAWFDNQRDEWERQQEVSKS